jgi:hypothetical protein
MISGKSQSDETSGANKSSASAKPSDENRMVAMDDSLNEDQILALLKSSDLAAEQIEQIARNSAAMKSRKVRLAVAANAHAPRRVSLRVIREFYTFDLVQFGRIPAAAADLKRIADELLISRLASITLGERISLARRSSALVAAALLLDRESSVWQPALENPRLTEVAIVKALQRPTVTAALVEAICRHPKWSVRREVRIALLRNQHTPLARAIEFARRLPPPLLRDVLRASKLPEKIKEYLRKELLQR